VTTVSASVSVETLRSLVSSARVVLSAMKVGDGYDIAVVRGYIRGLEDAIDGKIGRWG
jgi:hypothetical protein